MVDGVERRSLPASLLVVAIAVSASGATCKGTDPGPSEAPAQPPPETVRAEPPPPPAPSRLEGVELERVPPANRGAALRILQESFCYCGCARTVAACLSDRSSCSCVRCSERVAEFVISELEQGGSPSQVEAASLELFSEAYGATPKKLDLADQPSLGPEDAEHTLVEFADFRCPHCRDAFGELVGFAKAHPEVRLVYYYFPLSSFGEVSVAAARAAEAARRQGRFWEMAAVLYDSQTSLGSVDYAALAGRAGLDLERFERDFADESTLTAVMADKSMGERLGIQGTPTIYLDGRPLGLGHDQGSLGFRLAMEKDRTACN